MKSRRDFYEQDYLPALRRKRTERLYVYGPPVLIGLTFLLLAVLVGHEVV